MRRFLTIMICLALAFAAPTVCLHALDLDQAMVHEAMDGHSRAHAPDTHDHAIHHHAMHDPGMMHHHAMDAVPEMSHDTHPGCADSCEGGASCSGCAVVTGLMKFAGDLLRPPHGAPMAFSLDGALTGLVSAFDPPPPRA